MVTGAIGRVGVLWRGDRDARDNTTAENNRLRSVFDALAAADVTAEPVVFGDEMVDEVRDQLGQLDGVLVWVDPIMGEQDRTRLDALLREVASAADVPAFAASSTFQTPMPPLPRFCFTTRGPDAASRDGNSLFSSSTVL